MYQILALMFCLLVVGGAALWGLNGLRWDFGAALGGYQKLRTLYQIGSHVETARMLGEMKPAQVEAARGEIGKAMEILEVDFGGDLQGDEKKLREALGAAVNAGDMGACWRGCMSRW